MAGFLSPIHVGIQKGKRERGGKSAMGDLDDISDNEGSEYNEKIEGEDEDDEEYDDELDGKGRRR